MILEEIIAIHQQGRLEEAKLAYLKLLEQEPKNVTVLHMLALLFAELNDLEQAETFLQRALELDPHNPSMLLHHANILKAKGLFSQAAVILEQLALQKPDFAAVFNNLGTVYYAQAKLPQAVEAYEKAISLQSDYIDAYYNLALALTKLGRMQQALTVYAALLELAPQHSGARFQLACLYMQMNEHQKAIQEFKKIEESHPYHFETQTNLATSYLKSGKLLEAKSHYLKALEITPNDTQILFNLGVIEMQLGKLQDATNYYLQVVKFDNSNFAAHNNLAYIFLVTKHQDLSLQHFKEALRLQPDNLALKHTIDILTQQKNISGSPLEYIEALFDSYADHFDEHLQNTLDYQIPKLFYTTLNDMKLLHPDLSILDLGCGTGLCGAWFKTFAKKMIGVDISQKMLALAKQKNIYDELVQDDIVKFLQNTKQTFDLILAGDVIVYAGDLHEVIACMANSLAENGIIIMDTEIDNEEDYRMTSSGRFAHKRDYVERLIKENDLRLLYFSTVPIRQQEKNIVYGNLFVMQK